MSKFKKLKNITKEERYALSVVLNDLEFIFQENLDTQCRNYLDLAKGNLRDLIGDGNTMDMVSDDSLQRIPVNMRQDIKNYIERGVRLSGFLEAVFENKLVSAVGRADTVNLKHLQEYAQFVYSWAPRGCWGSEKAVQEWCEAGGLEGLYKKAEAEANNPR